MPAYTGREGNKRRFPPNLWYPILLVVGRPMDERLPGYKRWSLNVTGCIVGNFSIRTVLRATITITHL